MFEVALFQIPSSIVTPPCAITDWTVAAHWMANQRPTSVALQLYKPSKSHPIIGCDRELISVFTIKDCEFF